jgi:hypothetical protein
MEYPETCWYMAQYAAFGFAKITQFTSNFSTMWSYETLTLQSQTSSGNRVFFLSDLCNRCSGPVS